MNLKFSNEIKAKAKALGFSFVGIAKAQAVEEATAEQVKQWVQKGYYADMHYMAANLDKRLDPRLLMPGVRSIVSVALNYAPQHSFQPDELQISAYALGKDYHDIIKNKLHQLALAIGCVPYPQGELDAEELQRIHALPEVDTAAKDTSNPILHHSNADPIYYRAFTDTAPVLERYWATQAGLGWIGRNHQLIIPGAGSMFFLGELFLTIPLVYDVPMPNRCGRCHRCIDACPTSALGTFNPQKPFQTYPLDAYHCLSYQTIENRGSLSQEAVTAMENMFYGCDRCLTACPWHRFSSPTTIEELHPKPELLAMTKEQWYTLTEEQYRNLFKGSAVKRAKYSGIMRNINAIKAREASSDTSKEE